MRAVAPVVEIQPFAEHFIAHIKSSGLQLHFDFLGAGLGLSAGLSSDLVGVGDLSESLVDFVLLLVVLGRW